MHEKIRISFKLIRVFGPHNYIESAYSSMHLDELCIYMVTFQMEYSLYIYL